MNKIKYFILASLFLLTFGLVSCSNPESSSPSVPQQDQEENRGNSEAEAKNITITYTNTVLENTSIEDTVEEIYDTVVSIDSYKNNQLFGSGSGVLFGYDEELSYIATCHHVIEDCAKFMVNLSNGKQLEAKLVGGDALSDIAVLSIEQIGLSYASWFEDTDTLRLGSGVICIGNPLGTLPGSVSTGVVSYKNRKVQVDDYHTLDLIQTDVAINQGNSGGGLFNTAGALIGIVNAKYSSSGIEGLGFAIPANTAKGIIEELLTTATYDKVSKTWKTGYVENRWNLGLTLAYGGYGFVRTSICISNLSENDTDSDYNKFEVYDQLTSIKIMYQDSSKEPKSLDNISASTTIEAVYQFIFSSDMSLGDILEFQIIRNGQAMTIEIPLVQYRYSI